MTEKFSPNTAAELRAELHAVRGRYDKLSRGEVASLRRCRTADELALEGTYWRIGGPLAQQRVHLPHVVLLFPLAQHSAKERFSFGRFLNTRLRDNDGAKLRVRRVLGSRDRDELDHRLRGLLRLACVDRNPVDWGGLGTDILFFFADSGAVRRKWAQDFYAPTAPRAAAPSTLNT